MPVSDALDRGDLPRGLVLELGSGIGDASPILEDRLGPTVAVDLAMDPLNPLLAVNYSVNLVHVILV